MATTQHTQVEKDGEASCFDAQVGALLSVNELQELPVIAVLAEKKSVKNVVLDTGRESQIEMDRSKNVCRGIPELR